MYLKFEFEKETVDFIEYVNIILKCINDSNNGVTLSSQDLSKIHKFEREFSNTKQIVWFFFVVHFFFLLTTTGTNFFVFFLKT